MNWSARAHLSFAVAVQGAVVMSCTAIVIDADHTSTEQGRSAIAEPRLTATPRPANSATSPSGDAQVEPPEPSVPADSPQSPLDASVDAAVAAPDAGDAASQLSQTTNSVLLISVDGLAERFVRSEIDAGRAPTFARLQREGSWTLNARTEARISVTLPNHTSMMSGRPAVLVPDAPADTHHGFLDNYDAGDGATLHSLGNPDLPYVTSIFDEVHDRSGFTALYAGKSKFLLYRRSYSPPASRVDSIGDDDGGNKIDSFDVIEDTSSLAGEFMKAVEVGVTQHPAGPNFSMLHIRDTDSNGHAYGWGSPQYMQALALADHLIGGVLDAITASPSLHDTVVIVTTDHGGVGTGHFDTTLLDVVAIPFFVWGKGVPAGRDLYAVSSGRADPEQTIPMDATANQPIRNGDAANLALDLMGLPAIDGSLHRGFRLALSASENSTESGE